MFITSITMKFDTWILKIQKFIQWKPPGFWNSFDLQNVIRIQIQNKGLWKVAWSYNVFLRCNNRKSTKILDELHRLQTTTYVPISMKEFKFYQMEVLEFVWHKSVMRHSATLSYYSFSKYQDPAWSRTGECKLCKDELRKVWKSVGVRGSMNVVDTGNALARVQRVHAPADL